MSFSWPKCRRILSTFSQRNAIGSDDPRSSKMDMSRVLCKSLKFFAPKAWPHIGSMAPHRPFRTEKQVTFAKVNPRVPPAKGSSPSRPRKAVVMASFANHVKFIATNGTEIRHCVLSSEERGMGGEEIEGHFGR